MTPLLSVLIPAVPSRIPAAGELYMKLLADAFRRKENGDVEILMLTDNKLRTVGDKRQALVDLAQGVYIAFVDDDDDVAPQYIERVLEGCRAGVDVVTFPTSSSLNGGPPAIGRHSLVFENEEWRLPFFFRKPWMCHAWQRRLAQGHIFPALNYGEDAPWCAEMAAKAKTERLIGGEPLYFYNWSAAGTEAK
jgi:hypothetical protein